MNKPSLGLSDRSLVSSVQPRICLSARRDDMLGTLRKFCPFSDFLKNDFSVGKNTNLEMEQDGELLTQFGFVVKTPCIREKTISDSEQRLLSHFSFSVVLPIHSHP